VAVPRSFRAFDGIAWGYERTDNKTHLTSIRRDNASQGIPLSCKNDTLV
jgi:hypothetical protein